MLTLEVAILKAVGLELTEIPKPEFNCTVLQIRRDGNILWSKSHDRRVLLVKPVAEFVYYEAMKEGERLYKEVLNEVDWSAYYD